MERKIEKYGDYAGISGRMLERMKNFASEGDFDAAFSRVVDLIEEDNVKFDEFLEKLEVQEKMAERIKNISEIINSQDKINNPADLAYEIPRLLLHIKPETIEDQEIQDRIQILKEFIEDQEV